MRQLVQKVVQLVIQYSRTSPDLSTTTTLVTEESGRCQRKVASMGRLGCNMTLVLSGVKHFYYYFLILIVACKIHDTIKQKPNRSRDQRRAVRITFRDLLQ